MRHFAVEALSLLHEGAGLVRACHFKKETPHLLEQCRPGRILERPAARNGSDQSDRSTPCWAPFADTRIAAAALKTRRSRHGYRLRAGRATARAAVAAPWQGRPRRRVSLRSMHSPGPRCRGHLPARFDSPMPARSRRRSYRTSSSLVSASCSFFGLSRQPPLPISPDRSNRAAGLAFALLAGLSLQ